MDKYLHKLKVLWSKTNRFHRGLLLILLIELKVLPGWKMGFQCNDPTLSHPFTGDTISWKWLMVICSLLPLVVMLIVERKYHNTDTERTNKRTLQWYKEYMFGYLVNLCVIQVIKLIVGSPRPHFFDTCRPEEANTCEGSEFVSSYSCTKTHWNMQSDRSFPSGHTSLALHAGLFIAYYIEKRLVGPVLRRRCMQAAALSLAAGCALSRLTDRRHHCSDVLAGAGVAALPFLYTVFHLCKNFECATKSDAKEDTSANENGSPIQTANIDT